MRHAAELARACGWLDDHLDAFRVHDGPVELGSLKAIGELANTAEILIRSGADRARGERWVDHGWSQLEQGAVLERKVAADPRMCLVATLAVPFAWAGRRSPSLERQLEAAAAWHPFTPHEWMILGPNLAALGVPFPQRPTASLLGERPYPWRLDLKRLYVLLHEILYATSWGAHAPRWSAENGRWCERWLPALLGGMTDAGDSDLVAELALVTACLGGAVPEAAWTLLAGRQGPDGVVIAPARRNAWNPADVGFSLHQHTTVTSVMAWALARP